MILHVVVTWLVFLWSTKGYCWGRSGDKPASDFTESLFYLLANSVEAECYLACLVPVSCDSVAILRERMKHV